MMDDFIYEMADGIDALAAADEALSHHAPRLVAEPLLITARTAECIANKLQQEAIRLYAAAEKRHAAAPQKCAFSQMMTLANDPDYRVAAEKEEAALYLSTLASSQRLLADQFSTGQLRFRHSGPGRPTSPQTLQEEIRLAFLLLDAFKMARKRYRAVEEVSAAEKVSVSKLHRIWRKYIERRKARNGRLYYAIKTRMTSG